MQQMIIKISSLIESLAETIDLVSNEVNNHHRKVACIAASIGEAVGLPTNRFENLIVAAALHDVGGLTTKDRLSLLNFEENQGTHSLYGYLLLKRFRPFAYIAPIVRYHHTFWDHGLAKDENGEQIPIESQIIFLADRISVLIGNDFHFGQIASICQRINNKRDTQFKPELVDIFLKLSVKECFWLDARDAFSQPMFEAVLSRNLNLNTEDLLGLGKLYSQIIDFRSSVTATHSSGVSVVGETLAGLYGFSKEECVLMRLAGYLHDIGKLIVPEEILEKPARLTSDEYDKMKSHTYYTNRLLMGIKEFDTVRMWASMHHERIDGSGYPCRSGGSSLPLGSRILAVADVFVAVTEDRPYRSGMTSDAALAVLTGMAGSGALDQNVVNLLESNYSVIDEKRRIEQENARQEYSKFYSA
jgi:HD-GYP domain-containing protein (c-di-GMP phosphodiesterase class II)